MSCGCVGLTVALVSFGGVLLLMSSHLPFQQHPAELRYQQQQSIASLENVTLSSSTSPLSESQDEIDVRFDCSNVSTLRFVSTDRAMWRTTTFTIRRPNLLLFANWSAAVDALRREYESFRLFTTFHVATTFGGCFDASSTANRSNTFFVQQYYPHYELQDILLMKRQLPWCVRNRIAVGLLTMANQLSRPKRDATHAVFCDWRLRHFVVLKKDYRVVCIDLSSLRLLPVVNGSEVGLNENEPCKHKSKSYCHSLNQCWLGTDLGVQEDAGGDDDASDEPHIIAVAPDGKCDGRTHRCPGFDRKSHGWFLGKGILPLLVVDDESNITPTESDMIAFTGMLEFNAVLSSVSRYLSVGVKRKRLNLDVAISRLKEVFGFYEGQQCYAWWQWHERVN